MALKDRVKQLEFDVERIRKNSVVMTYDFGPVDLRWCAHELASHLKKDAEPASQAGAKAAHIPEEETQMSDDRIKEMLGKQLQLLSEHPGESTKELSDTALAMCEIANILLPGAWWAMTQNKS